MKALIQSLAVAVALSLPLAAFAQSTAPVTRASVRAELIQLERAGYEPARNNPDYPNDIQAARARMGNSFGGVEAGSSAAGRPVSMNPYTAQ
ncbi:hypothetical protein WM40_10540 [Robbsia andropogonis]|uniref:Purine nucleoside phosphorylase n=1 Tax=Robbsia andropogonis TaxID=28092 RepID=A0A0F5K1E3_9BURK|nr:DUF4148 domain-containing protein [Robbsia andropogonis]KKB63740.1 hypothetical protein WM40_10540 [Robbsia andropogonis]